MSDDPLAHVRDSYYFHVPNVLWRYDFQDVADVPEDLRALSGLRDGATVEQYEAELTGKIIIPQPFGVLQDLHSKASGFCVSRFMVIELTAAILVAIIFIWIAGKTRSGSAPRGRFWNFFELLLLFVRDEVARPAIGKHDADRFLPFLWTIFFFVLFCNLMGMVPWMGTPTGALATTGTLALITFSMVVGAGVVKLGPAGYLKAQVPHMELPKALAVFLVPMIFCIEVMGLLIKHTVLAVRLLANMFAGHVVLAVILGFIGTTAGTMLWWGVMPASVMGATALSMLELFVAFLQAYIFTFLSALFIGAAVHPH